MRHVTCIRDSRHMWMIPFTYECVISRMNESCHVRSSQVATWLLHTGHDSHMCYLTRDIIHMSLTRRLLDTGHDAHILDTTYHVPCPAWSSQVAYLTRRIHTWKDSFICGMPHSEWHDVFVWDMPGSCVTWLVHIIVMTYLIHIWRDSFRVRWLIRVRLDSDSRDMARSCVTWCIHKWNDSFICGDVTWLLHMCCGTMGWLQLVGSLKL